MPDWAEGYVQTNGARVHTYRTGGGGPPVVLVHGFTDDGLCWTPVAQDLEDAFDVIMVDVRGHGKSAPVRATPTVDIVADLAGLIEALALERPAVLGHSMGAAAAAQAAARYPALVGAALLEDPPWRPLSASADPQQEHAQWRKRMGAWEAGTRLLRTKPREAIVATARAEHPTWPEAELGPWADSKLRLDLDIYRVPLLPQTPWTELAPRIRCPTLLITGDPDRGAIVTPEVAQQVIELLPCGQHVHIAHAGHSIRREGYPRYIEAVRAFLSHWEATRCS